MSEPEDRSQADGIISETLKMISQKRGDDDPYIGADLIARATEIQASGNDDEAVELCQEALKLPYLSAMSIANLVIVLRRAGRSAMARQVEEYAEKQFQSALDANQTDNELRIALGNFLYGLGRNEKAEVLLAEALKNDPMDMGSLLAITDIRLEQNDPEGALAYWRPAFEKYPADGRIPLQLAKILAFRNFRESALELLKIADPLCTEKRREFEFVAAGIRGSGEATAQAAMAVEIFDGFSDTYDEGLKKIRNQGPRLVADVLGNINWRTDRGLDVLDAGCGTGLCAPTLRPMARMLHGVDLSVGMLKKAKEKNIYDLLGRADLATLGSMPDGPFDLIVSSDVLVYFGNLSAVMENFSTLLRSGGWLVLTVEDAGSDRGGRGWTLQSTGRYKHSMPYLNEVLKSAGFGGPKIVLHEGLRYEFGQVVPGTALAAQKLAILGG